MSLAAVSRPGADGPERAARALKETPGVAGVVICDEQGEILVATEAGSATAREGALATFASRRGEALTLEGDLRGMGKVLAGSQLRHIVWSGPRGDAICLSSPGSHTFLACRPGAAGEVLLASAAAIIRRYL